MGGSIDLEQEGEFESDMMLDPLYNLIDLQYVLAAHTQYMGQVMGWC